MKLLIYIVATIVIGAINTAHGGDHIMGTRQECMIDSYPGSYWHYYYCGSQDIGCKGHRSAARDQHHTLYDGDKLKFTTGNKETYWCCGGTSTQDGIFVKGDNFYTETKTTVKNLGNGAKCNQITRKTVCGETEFIDCDTPDQCSPGAILRNDECVAQCGDDEVFESAISNKCVTCETTATQGPSKDHLTCIKCDKYTEFFDRKNKKCISRDSVKFTQYSKEAMQECWRCPRDLFNKCVKSVTEVNKMDVSGTQRLNQIDAIAAFEDNTSIVKKCYLGE